MNGITLTICPKTGKYIVAEKEPQKAEVISFDELKNSRKRTKQTAKRRTK